jgi:hypothetical protein
MLEGASAEDVVVGEGNLPRPSYRQKNMLAISQSDAKADTSSYQRNRIAGSNGLLEIVFNKHRQSFTGGRAEKATARLEGKVAIKYTGLRPGPDLQKRYPIRPRSISLLL